ncbi:MAG: alpha/beta hydrolase [Cyanobacteria bacterium TGS_CYA1]|nr:alpha/beta hydrolase [Cyanobacteria bacterium TGS_CYA1]
MNLLKALWNDLTAAFSIRQWQETLASVKSIKKENLRKTVLLLLPQMVLYYILFSPIVAGALYDNLLFHPTKVGHFDATFLTGVKIENVSLKSGKETLHSWFLRKSQTSKVALICHGNGGNLTNRAELMKALLDQNVSVFIFDYQGYGKSTGSPSIPKIISDSRVALNYLLDKEKYKQENIILFGESLGTGLACKLSTEIKSGGIILLSPYCSILRLAREKLIWLNLYPDFMFTFDHLDNAKILSKPHSPLLIIHGAKDRLIPVAHAEKLYATAVDPKQLVLLKDSGHNDIFLNDALDFENGLKRYFK